MLLEIIVDYGSCNNLWGGRLGGWGVGRGLKVLFKFTFFFFYILLIDKIRTGFTKLIVSRIEVYNLLG